ncbi:MAG: ABC transporter ATP-binding protein [Planctomycetes bacterium]|nr:ABC transporter ATP-binding protein [Planctomycetota bacterium]
MSLVIDQLSFSYGRVEALQGVTVQANSGKLTAILGPNASGKSTLLRCVIGSLKPLRGVVLIDGKPVHAMKARDLARRVAYVPQRSTVSASFTVREVVELGRYRLPRRASRVDEAIERLELVEVAGREYSALSVGQQQRVMLARALAQIEPDGLLILDEPTSAMDLRHEHDAMNILQELAAAGATVLLVMHDVTLAGTVADDVWLLDRGKLVVSSQAADVLTVERLEEVFGVKFESIRTEGGRIVILPEVCPRNEPAIISKT